MIRVGVDVGGTFTDIILENKGSNVANLNNLLLPS